MPNHLCRRARTLRAAALIALSAVVLAPLGGAAAHADTVPALGYDPIADKGSLHHISTAVGAQDAWAAGYTGEGVGVALIDSGVARVPGLTGDNIIDGPDLSFESQYPDLVHKDTFGHGTHMASIIAGRDEGMPDRELGSDPTKFVGIAPDATLVSLKVASYDGAVDVTQVIAAIDWVVEHKDDPGMNIRVINLSYGTDSTAGYKTDPLTFAVENAWRHGITVVVAGGNDGSTLKNLANPAQDPYVLAVGADDTQGTVNEADDEVPAFGNRGSNTRHVDLVAPGVSVLGLRDPGSHIDDQNPTAIVGERFFRGSGTSQAAAVVSGAAALLLQRYPDLTPDQVKRHLMATSLPFKGSTVQYRGNGLLRVDRAITEGVAATAQSAKGYATGGGSLEKSRGTVHVNDGEVDLTGEVDIFGSPFDSAAWARATATGTAWEGGTWNGVGWTGSGRSSSGSWTTAPWSRGMWSGKAWTDSAWSGKAWSGKAWSGKAWSGKAWSGKAWSGKAWS